MSIQTYKPAVRNESSQILYYLILTVPVCLLGSLAIMSVLAPILEEGSHFSVSNFLYRFLSRICHQYPTRCLWIFNRPMGLCSRCFSLYSSLSIGLLCLPLIPKLKPHLLCALLLIPLVADGLLQYANLAASNNFRRVLTGVLFGAAVSVIYKGSAFYLLSNLGADSRGRMVNHFRRNLNLAFSVGVLFFTIFYSVAAYLL
jgi:uncharacterized membrane protein